MAAAGAELTAQIDNINKQAVQIKSAATGFKAAAGSGFHIEPEAAATLIGACHDALQQVAGLTIHLADIREAPKLGKTPGATVVSGFTQQVATDDQGIEPALINLRGTLTDMIAAYQKASTNYAETEAIIAKSLKAT